MKPAPAIIGTTATSGYTTANGKDRARKRLLEKPLLLEK